MQVALPIMILRLLQTPVFEAFTNNTSTIEVEAPLDYENQPSCTSRLSEETKFLTTTLSTPIRFPLVSQDNTTNGHVNYFG